MMKFRSLLFSCILTSLALQAGAADVRYQPVPLEDSHNPSNRRSWGISINNHGIVAGWVDRFDETPYPSGSIKGVFYSDPATGFHEVGDYEGAYSQGGRINDQGQFVVQGGRGYDTNGVSVYVEDALRFTPGVGFERLGDLGGPVAQASGINFQGDVVGWSSTSATNIYEYRHAFLYTDERGLVDLGTFGGTSAAAADINDDGWISGFSVIPGQGNTAWMYHEQQGVTYLGHGVAKRINEQRVIICDNEYGELVLIKNGRVVPIRGNAEVDTDGLTGDLNDWNVVVGSGYVAPNLDSAGYIWTESQGARDLNKLIATNSGWSLWYAFDINNRGQITGMGGFEGRSQAFRLDPIPPRPTIARSGTNVVVTWSPAWPGLVLESSSELASTNWSTVLSGGTNVVRVSISGGNRYFRLNLDGIRGLCCVPE